MKALHLVPICHSVIKGIHRKRMPVKEVRSGQSASFSLKKVILLFNILVLNLFNWKMFDF